MSLFLTYPVSIGTMMIVRLRELRLARGLTLEDVANRCVPPTTPQTIGRLETGLRTLSIDWLERIASAMCVNVCDLITDIHTSDLKVAAIIGAAGGYAPKRDITVVPPQFPDGYLVVTFAKSQGEYRAGDELWCEVLQTEQFGRAVNRDVLVPRPGKRFLFGRLIDRNEEKLHVLPPSPGGRQQIVGLPQWIAVARRLSRPL